MKIETVKPHQLCYVVYLSIFSFFILINLTAAGVREKLGLVAHWTFDKGTLDAKTVQDNLGKNNGLIVGKPKIQKGVHGDALNFNGTVDFVKITEDIFFPSISIEAVINPNLGTRNPIYDKYNYGIQLLDNNQVGVWIRADTNQQNKHWPSAYTSFPNDGKWHHVVGVVTNKKHVQIFLDGDLKKTTPAPHPISVAYGANDKPTIAYTRHLNGIWYAGSIDEVAVYETALNETNVKTLYTTVLAVEKTMKLSVVWGKIKVR